MPSTQPVANLRYPWERIAAIGGSMILHAVLLIILGLMVIQSDGDSLVTMIVSGFNQKQPDIAPPIETVVPELTSTQQDSTATANLVTSVSPNFLDPQPTAGVDAPPQLVTVGIPTGGLSERVAVAVSASTNSGSDDGLGDAATGEPGMTSFFGLSVNSSKVVYVVDSSRSMNYPYPGEAKTRFGRVKLELLSTIARMDESDKFFMIFFNHVPVPMPADRLMEATPAVQKRFLTWMTYLKANGQTEPEHALMIALSLNPEVIYFLTDGDFDYKVVPNVSKANRNGVIINTIGFGDDRGEKFMKELAARNSGEYKFIPGGDIPTTKSIVSQLKMKTQAQQERQ